ATEDGVEEDEPHADDDADGDINFEKAAEDDADATHLPGDVREADEDDITVGVVIGMGLVFFYAVLGGMKGITYTQVAQYCVLIFAFMVPAFFISIMLTGSPIPQIGFGGQLSGEIGSRIAGGEAISLLDKLDGLHEELGFAAYTEGRKSTLDVFMITMALMVGTAGLPHVIIRFYTVPRVRDARISAGWALLFIAILYTTAPAIAAFARTNLIDTVRDAHYSAEAAPEGARVAPDWFKRWEETGLIAWTDRNGDGRIQYTGTPGPIVGKPAFAEERGAWGERLITNDLVEVEPQAIPANELFIDRDIMVLANPEIARLPSWVIGLVAAGGLAAALSTAAGLLLVVSTAISHDLLKKTLTPNISEKQELICARIAAAIAVLAAGYLGINPPDYVAAIVAFAFGLAASSFFPAIILGVFSKRANREGVILGMVLGIAFTTAYILMFKFTVLDGLLKLLTSWDGAGPKSEHYLLGISPEGIGSLGMLLNFTVAYIVSYSTKPPPQEIQDLIEEIRLPAGSGEAHDTSA
ncbi:MAG: VC_2705 family sodium/solute symporter, partial [Planctomycetota bacterium]